MSHEKQVISISNGTIIRTIVIIGLAVLFFYIRDLILIFLTSVVLASAIEPATQWFRRRGLPRVLSVIIIYFLLLSFVAAFIYFILPSFLDELSSFLQLVPKYITTLNIKTHDGIGSDFFSWQNAVQGLSKSESVEQAAKNLVTSASTASGSLLAALSILFGGAISAVLVIFISFYLTVQEHGIEDFLRLITPLKREEYVISLWHRTQRKIGRWIQGQFVLALIVGVLVYIGLTVLGVQNALFLAFISTVFEIIPVFGPFVGSVPGVLVAFVQGGAPFGFIVALMYLVIQQIESNVIYPLVVRKVLDIPPLIVIIALVVGAQLGGLLGVLISIPVAVAITEYMTDIGKNRMALREQITTENGK